MLKPKYTDSVFVKQVSSPTVYDWPSIKCATNKYSVAVLDCGIKFSLLNKLSEMDCSLKIFPCDTPADEILKTNPGGILLSPGPGNPELLDDIVENVKILAQNKPIMGICLGNLLIGRAFGAQTYKMGFGHHGNNQPVKELESGRVHITCQNHRFALDSDTVTNGLEVSFINLNDGSVEGVRHTDLPIFGVQYYAEASPDPLDMDYLFKKFLALIDKR
jgi:carbamoyl-phosphate synthase small subunit